MLLDGKSLGRKSPSARVRQGIALCPEGRRVFPRLTVAENVQVAALGVGESHKRSRQLAAEILAGLTAPRSGPDSDPVRCMAIREGSREDELMITAVRMSHQPRRGSPAAILFLRRGADLQQQFRPQHLRDLFGFTPAETRIANALLAGERVEDVASRLGVRTDTVRGHIKRMLAKTGTRRQSDLVYRLANAVPNLRAFAPAA